MAANLEKNVFIAARFSCAYREPFVFFFIDQVVLARRSTKLMPIQTVLALGLVIFHGIKKRLVVIGPGHGANFVGDDLRVLASAQIAHAQLVPTDMKG